MTRSLLFVTAAALGATSAFAAPLVLNEYNAVSSDSFLNGGDEFVDEDGNSPPPQDPFFGRVAGNGGDWFELVVVAEGLDVRGWQLEITDDGQVQPRLLLTNSPVWARLEAGTVITVAEAVADDVSFDPDAGDWWINVMAADPANGGTGEYISARDFPVSNDDWQLRIYDAAGALVFGPAGEGIVDDDGVPSGIGVNSREVFALQTSPAADVGRADAGYNDAIFSSFGAPNTAFDVEIQDFAPLRTDQPWPDRDSDGISEDGDRSGVIGDTSCTAGATDGCDDNCPVTVNPRQSDAGGVGDGGADGIGDACQCGDVSADGRVRQRDAALIVAFLQGQILDLPVPGKCDVDGDRACTYNDARIILRAQFGLPPGIVQSCEAAAGPLDETDRLYAPDRVVEIDITMAPEDFAELRAQTRDFVELLNDPDCGSGPWPNPYSWFPAEVLVDGRQTIPLAGVRKKGFFGSLSEAKPALKLDLNRFVAGRDIDGVAQLTLNNSIQDPSFAKQCLAFSIFAAAGIPAPRCNFAQVSVNGEELGIFVNVEEMDEQFVARHFQDPTGKLFEAEFSDFWTGPWQNTWDPDTQAAEDGNEEIVDLATVLVTSPPGELLGKVQERVDVGQFLRYWAVEALIAHTDGYADKMNNAFVYIDPADTLMRFTPWDTDSDFLRANQSLFAIRAALARKLFNLSPTRAGFLAAVEDLLDGVWAPESYLAEIDRVDALLSPRLIELGQLEELADMRSFQQVLRAWIDARAADVRAQLADPPPVVPDEQIPHLCERQLP